MKKTRTKRRDLVYYIKKTMKYSAFLALLVCSLTSIAFAEKSYGQQLLEAPVTLRLHNATLGEALDKITRQTRVQFVFVGTQPQQQRPSNLNVEREPLEKVLGKLLSPYGLHYQVVENRIVIQNIKLEPIENKINILEPERSAGSPLASIRYEQMPDRSIVPAEMIRMTQLRISGRVSDESGQALPGVNVLIKGTQQGLVTDAEGRFAIEVAGENAVLVFSFVGYMKQEILVGKRAVLEVSMKEDAAVLQEALVIGYGTQSRNTLTTSVSKLDTKVLENVTYANAASALQGTVSGVRVQNPSGQPGAAPRVIVRGGTSINNPNGASPLYVIDGIIRTDMNHINADDIESMQVLKDAASTSIYGARGSNGIVIITTKSGKAGSAQITYSYDLSLSDINKKYDFVSARDFIKFFRQGIVETAKKDPARLVFLTSASPGGTGNDLTRNTSYTTQYLTEQNKHKLNEGWQSMPDPLDPSKTIIFRETDFQDVIFRTGITNNHFISASGGTEKATFNAGLGYLINQGIAIGTDYKRLSLNLNGDLKIKDNLKAFGRLLYSNSAQNGNNWLYERTHATAPTAKYRLEDGTLAPGDAGFQNPEYLVDNTVEKNSMDNVTIALGAHWELLPGLSFDPQVSLYNTIGDGRRFLKAAYYNGPNGFVNTRDATANYGKTTNKQADATLSYIKSLGTGHNLDAKIGFSYYGSASTSMVAGGRGAASDLIPTLNAAPTPTIATSNESESIVVGYFSRINYNFGEKYLLSLNARYDGASNLGAKYKWGFFPGISAGWNLHNENFWKALPADLSSLKLRASYGVNGNIGGLGPYSAQGGYSVGSRYGGVSAVQNTVLANDELKWEQSKTFNIGLDLGIFSDRVGIIFDAYSRVTDNLITNFNLPPSTGFGSILTNLGSLQNKGIEIELNARVLPAQSPLQWNIAFNASRVKTKILKLPFNGAENNRIGGFLVWDPSQNKQVWVGGLQEGGRIGDFYAYKQVGVYATDEEAATAPTDMIISIADKRKYGGDVNWLDVDKNGVIDLNDRVYAGNIFPVWTGGFTNTLNYKNFGLTARFDYSTGNTIYNHSRAVMLSQQAAWIGITKDVLNSWQKQGDVTNIPIYRWADQVTNKNISRPDPAGVIYGGSITPNDSGNSEFYESGNYLAVRELTLSYSINSPFLKKHKLNSIKVNITGHNLHYFTNYKGLNPENTGQDNGGYPIPRNIIFGVKFFM